MSGDRSRERDRPFVTDRPFRLEELPFVDPDAFEPMEAAAIERAIIERENLIQSLQTDVLEIEGERNVLENRLSRLESERDELQERVRQLEVERPKLEPTAVFTNLGSAIGEAREELDETNYAIGDVEFNLKVNVVQTDEGLRMHLPSLDETFASENLSEITFQVRAGPPEAEREETGYNEVPDLVGLQRSSAERQLAQSGLSVGDVTTVDEPSEEPDTLVGQFPEPYTLAPPDAPVDLTVVTERDEPGPAEGPRGPENERIREEFVAAIERAELDAESEFAERLREAGIEDLRELADEDPQRIAAITELPVRTVVRLREDLAERLRESPTRRLEEIDGIGPAFASRLREGGVEGVAALAEMDPGEVAEITRVSTRRAEAWIEQARSMIE